MGYLDRNLLPGERVVFRTSLHWIHYLPALVCFAVAIAAAVAATTVPDGAGAQAGLLATAGVFVLLGVVTGLVRWVGRSSCEFGVTDHRVVIKMGVVRRRSVELLLRQVEGIGVDQSIAGRMLGFGDVSIIGTGGTTETFRRIARPLEFRRQVQAQSITRQT